MEIVKRKWSQKWQNVTKSVHYNTKNNHEMEKKQQQKTGNTSTPWAHRKVQSNWKNQPEKGKLSDHKHVQATSCHFIAQLCLLQKRQGAVICHHCPACGCYWPLFKTTKLEVSHMEFNKNNPTVPKTTTVTRNGTHAELAYFLKSALNSPKAAPVLEEVGVLSWPASTAASAPPWSLYETPVDMLSFKANGRQRKLTRLFLRAMKCS